MGTSFPAAASYSGATTTATRKQAVEDILAAAKELPGAQAVSTLVIAAGVITPTKAVHVVDTEGAAATDDLTNATLFSEAGRILILSNLDDAKVTTVKHAAGGNGQFLLADEVDFLLRDVDEWIAFIRVANDWVELLRSSGYTRLRRIISVTEVAASPRVLLKSESGSLLVADQAAGAINVATLPAATVGAYFDFISGVSAFGLKFNAAGSDKIRRSTTLGAGGGSYTAAAAGVSVRLTCYKAAEWIVTEEVPAAAGTIA